MRKINLSLHTKLFFKRAKLQGKVFDDFKICTIKNADVAGDIPCDTNMKHIRRFKYSSVLFLRNTQLLLLRKEFGVALID